MQGKESIESSQLYLLFSCWWVYKLNIDFHRKLIKTWKNLVELLDALSVDHDIEIGDKLIPMIEEELSMQEGTLIKYKNRWS